MGTAKCSATVLDSLQDLGGVAIGEALVIQNDVSGQGGQTRRHLSRRAGHAPRARGQRQVCAHGPRPDPSPSGANSMSTPGCLT